ncbi:MAG: hypothetical protein JNM93_07245 [Bacteriovoracaceae bacterium]|nr:hypothetical protein [Bacteriovoracaceae bacterium]
MKPEETKKNLNAFFEHLSKFDSNQMMEQVGQYLDDEAIEIIIGHLEDFYGIENDEELGSLAQVLITGYLAAKFDTEKTLGMH